MIARYVDPMGDPDTPEVKRSAEAKSKFDVAAEFAKRADRVVANLTAAQRLVDGLDDLGSQFAASGHGPPGGFFARIYKGHDDGKIQIDPVWVEVCCSKAPFTLIQDIKVTDAGGNFEVKEKDAGWSMPSEKFEDCGALLKAYMEWIVAQTKDDDLRAEVEARMPGATKAEAKPQAPRDLEP